MSAKFIHWVPSHTRNRYVGHNTSDRVPHFYIFACKSHLSVHSLFFFFFFYAFFFFLLHNTMTAGFRDCYRTVCDSHSFASCTSCSSYHMLACAIVAAEWLVIDNLCLVKIGWATYYDVTTLKHTGLKYSPAFRNFVGFTPHWSQRNFSCGSVKWKFIFLELSQNFSYFWALSGASDIH